MSPILLKIRMISTEEIQVVIDEKLKETNIFVVDLSISANNSITVMIDSNENVSINDCIKLSKDIESNFDREEEDYELMVTSYGLDRPYKVLAQYKKHLNDDVEVVTTDGVKLEGKLVEVNGNDFSITFTKKVKIEGKKRKQLIEEKLQLKYDDVKSTKTKIKI